MPNPIEPSPMTAMRGLADAGMRRSLNVSLLAAHPAGGFASGYHGWPRCQSVGKRFRTDRAIRMSETKIREEICRLGRSLFERGLTPGSSGNISVKLDDGGWLVTPTNASLGSLDPARMSQLGAGRTAGFRRRPDQGSAPAHRALPDPHRRAGRGASAFDPFGGAVDAARDRPRAALPPMTPYYLMKCGQTALVPYYRARRSRGRRRDQGAGREILLRAARQSRAGGICGRYAGSRGVCDRGTGRDGETVSAVAGAEPAVSVAGAGEGFDEDVRADAAGAWARALSSTSSSTGTTYSRATHALTIHFTSHTTYPLIHLAFWDRSIHPKQSEVENMSAEPDERSDIEDPPHAAAWRKPLSHRHCRAQTRSIRGAAHRCDDVSSRLCATR